MNRTRLIVVVVGGLSALLACGSDSGVPMETGGSVTDETTTSSVDLIDVVGSG